MKCPNCNKDGPHFVPPSMGEDGFYICDHPDGRKATGLTETTICDRHGNEIVRPAPPAAEPDAVIIVGRTQVYGDAAKSLLDAKATCQLCGCVCGCRALLPAPADVKGGDS